MTRKTFRFPRRSLAIALALAAAQISLASSPGLALDASTPDWPCVYRKVPELSAATIWDGPAITDTTSWLKDEQVRKLSEYLISRRVKVEDAEAAIKKFADGLPADTHDAKLTELFAAVLTRTNDDRKVVMSGIERFHKRQLERAKEIEKEGIALPAEGERHRHDKRTAAGRRNQQTLGPGRKVQVGGSRLPGEASEHSDRVRDPAADGRARRRHRAGNSCPDEELIARNSAGAGSNDRWSAPLIAEPFSGARSSEKVFTSR